VVWRADAYVGRVRTGRYDLRFFQSINTTVSSAVVVWMCDAHSSWTLRKLFRFAAPRGCCCGSVGRARAALKLATRATRSYGRMLADVYGVPTAGLSVI
jgi:hypothetical protein